MGYAARIGFVVHKAALMRLWAQSARNDLHKTGSVALMVLFHPGLGLFCPGLGKEQLDFPARTPHILFMSALAFDSHAFVKRLTDAGMPERQAEVLATEQTRLIEADLATKADIKALEATTKKEIELTRRDIKALEAATKKEIELIRRDIKALEVTTKADIKALEAVTKKEIELTRRDIKALEVTTKADIKALEAATKADIKALEAATKKEIELIRRDMKVMVANTKSDILKWMFGALAGQTVLIVGLIRLL